MSQDVDGQDEKPYDVLPPYPVDARGWPIWVSEAEQRRRLPLEMASLESAWAIPPDETETDEMWDEILRNLGVDPETGRGLTSSTGL